MIRNGSNFTLITEAECCQLSLKNSQTFPGIILVLSQDFEEKLIRMLRALFL